MSNPSAASRGYNPDDPRNQETTTQAETPTSNVCFVTGTPCERGCFTATDTTQRDFVSLADALDELSRRILIYRTRLLIEMGAKEIARTLLDDLDAAYATHPIYPIGDDQSSFGFIVFDSSLERL